MRRRFVLSLLLMMIASTPVLAQSISPDVTSIAGALSVRGVLEGASSHGCSQSFASTSHRAELALELDARGGATLTIDHHTHETFGPSPGRYLEEGGETTRITDHVHVVMRGTATRTADGLVVVLASAERASARWQGWGSLPLPAPTATAMHATMRCAVARVDVLSSAPPDQRTASPHHVLECALDASPEPLDRFEPGPIVLGLGAGFVVRTDEPMWSHAPQRSIHVAP